MHDVLSLNSSWFYNVVCRPDGTQVRGGVAGLCPVRRGAWPVPTAVGANAQVRAIPG